MLADKSQLFIKPTMAYYIFANLESLIRKVMKNSHEHDKLHQFMMLRLFGVDITEIKKYDFEYINIKQKFIIKNNTQVFMLSLIHI